MAADSQRGLFDPRDLAREKNARIFFQLQGGVRRTGEWTNVFRCRLRIAGRRRFRVRDQTEDPFLLLPFQFGLETHQIIGRSLPILMPQLDDPVAFFPVGRIQQSPRFRGAVGQGFFPSFGHLFK